MSKIGFDLDSALYQPADLAEIADLDPKAIANWTDRGLGDPYGAGLGRGRARLYTGRDLLRFCLMRYLERIGVSIKAGTRIANMSFKEAFSVRNPGYLEVRGSQDGASGSVAWHPNLESVAQALKLRPAVLIIDTRELLSSVSKKADVVLHRKGARERGG